uniref:Ribosomal protein S13 n=1 Tax=Olisthodiscus luteus TaxID=83000 RepID=A0A7U0QGL0_OLILU|nr:ribosomal protein S13 [Olisthodiscus luteus]QQW50577.1 ribosomal protein S13 [Olisthodiscus luteus]
MVRLVGVDLPNDKRIEYALTSIYGIGLTTSREILDKANIDPNLRTKNLTDDFVAVLRSLLESDYQDKIEGTLRRSVTFNIKRLIDINCYRGRRHYNSLPLRGQRTRTNSRTRRNKRK